MRMSLFALVSARCSTWTMDVWLVRDRGIVNVGYKIWLSFVKFRFLVGVDVLRSSYGHLSLSNPRCLD